MFTFFICDLICIFVVIDYKPIVMREYMSDVSYLDFYKLGTVQGSYTLVAHDAPTVPGL